MKTESEMNQVVGKEASLLWNAMHRYNPEAEQVVAVKGEGSWFTDESGKRYLDGVSGLWCLNLGHGREEIVEAAAEQMKNLSYFPLTMNHQPAIKLAAKISELLGGKYQTFFSNSGSEANETAFKIARQYHNQTGNPQKYKVISRYRGYHGSTLGALSATAQANRRVKYDPGVPGFLHVYPPYSYRSIFDGSPEESDLKAAQLLEEMINWEGEETVAAFIMEPFISGGGVIVPSMKYIQRVAEICKKYNVLLIMDEVVSGYGRTGKMFGFKHAAGVQPDIVTMAKGLTSGYLPLGATAVKSEIYDVFREAGKDSHFRHVSTYGGHPAACAVALKNIDIIERENIVERVRTLAGTKLSELHHLIDHKNVGEVRQIGFLLGIEMVEDKQSKLPMSDEKLAKIIGLCKEKGLIIGKNGDTVPEQNNVIIVAPPLTSTVEDLDFLIDTLTSAIRSL
ncbi:aminotransferase [Oceanobacillus profundus]|uniref:Aminotransferase class III-fold pyridoxal phosphate-dependent enzyme n=1 Tax=Oceanobacillus profundus TaxID=372463 RepID=A0A417YDX0_9BACI|nr:aminotransferase [Oceanobacillus profundus]MCM3397538.1 aminotransferase [Oceanobacillus profundus]MDO6448567.1 aminotransferase [Oceanobacillus profundus]PAE28832.1 aspartate aminotransferase family protein [Paenibacillus sp. 7884-2]RHW30818.1 aminotransferase class III-fold pyridoxal phosphate-dependent enzyme [Oceanobacillus profundus]